MCDMGMTDKQFGGYIRLILDDLQDAKNEQDMEKKEKKLDKIIDILQSILED